MSQPSIFAAIDLGASSGRVIAGVFDAGNLQLHEIARFANGPVARGNQLFWDFDSLFASIATGLVELGEFASQRGAKITSIGIDTWAVDYGLIGDDGKLLSPPRHYRDQRNLLGVESVYAKLEPTDLYQVNGLQFQPFNTVFQLSAEMLQNPGLLQQAKHALLIPDLIGYLLTGIARTEVTNASTTGLLDVQTHQWNLELCDELNIDETLLTELIQPGEILGKLSEEYITSPAFDDTVITAVGSHDTASAILGVPLLSENGAYLSSGTWSLIGVELGEPITTEVSRRANFTNELGVENRVRYLKNLSGLWLLQECISTWISQGLDVNVADLVAAAALISTDARIDVNDPEFNAPGNMPARIKAHVQRKRGAVSNDPAEITRCILESLADAYASACVEIEFLTGKKLGQLNIVGGGSQNELLSQLAADRTGLRVLAGPVEATAIGNLVAQASAHGIVPFGLAAKRAFINASFAPKEFLPTTPAKENS